MVILLSFDKGPMLSDHKTSTVAAVIMISVAGLMEMLQVKVRGAIRPANRGPGGTAMITSGVETKGVIPPCIKACCC